LCGLGASTGSLVLVEVPFSLLKMRSWIQWASHHSTGFTWTEHNGGVEGGLSDMSYLPAYGVGYAFQINAANGVAFGKITRLVRAYLTQGLVKSAPPPIASLSAATRERFAGWYRGVSPRAQHLYPVERIPGVVRVSFTDSSLRVKPMLGEPGNYVAVDSVRFRRPGEPEATFVFVRDDANGRPEGIETMGAGLGMSMARVPAVDAIGTFAIAALCIAGVALSLVAMVFGALRWVVRRVRRRPSAAAAAAMPWRVAAFVAILATVHFGLLGAGSGDVRAIGTLTPLSGTMWATGILFGLAALAGAVLTWRTPAPAAAGRWARLSLWTVRGVATTNLIAAAYLTYWGWIGWRTWV